VSANAKYPHSPGSIFGESINKIMRNTNKVTGILFVICMITATCLSAQTIEGTRKYRVVAYKNGNPSITSMSNETEVTPYMSIYIPNTFTPNGDGMNDTFGAYGEAIKEFNMKIFNRWGQLVFESNNVNQRWDGTYDGTKVQEGSYVYRVSARGIQGKSQEKDGTVNIIY
jgi:gliding motility-associated-like protein